MCKCMKQGISFKTLRKINKQDVPKKTSTHTSEICCYISKCQIILAESIAGSLIGIEGLGCLQRCPW